MNVYCPKCEAANPEGAELCSMCGHHLGAEEPKRPHDLGELAAQATKAASDMKEPKACQKRTWRERLGLNVESTDQPRPKKRPEVSVINDARPFATFLTTIGIILTAIGIIGFFITLLVVFFELEERETAYSLLGVPMCLTLIWFGLLTRLGAECLSQLTLIADSLTQQPKT